MWLYPRCRATAGGIHSRQADTCDTLWHIVGGGSVERKRINIVYSGNVQGVGFRYTAKTTANGFDVTGTVRNLPDGRVELIAEGVKEELEAFRLAILESSGLRSCIRNEEVRWGVAQGQMRGFEIVR